MRRLAALMTGLAGGFTALRWLRRTRARGVETRDADAADPRAETLRRQLAEARAALGEPDEYDSGEVPVDQAEPVVLDPDERRRRVHSEGRAAAEAMRPRDDD